MIIPRLLVSCIASGEEAHLIGEVLHDKGGSVLDVVHDEPDRCCCNRCRTCNEHVLPWQRHRSTQYDPCDAGCEHHQTKPYGPLCHHSRTGKYSCDQCIAHVVLLRRLQHPPYAQEDEQVEEWIDDTRVEVERRQQRSSIDNTPEDAHAVGIQASADAVQYEHRDDAE